MDELTSIQLHQTTKERLGKRKLCDDESYEHVVLRVLDELDKRKEA